MMLSPILSRRRWKLYAHGQHIVVKRGMRERFVHPLMKAYLWALYLPAYPTASIEIHIGDKYKPDVVAFDDAPNIYQATKQPLFWGEAGRTRREKIQSLLKRFPDTHFVISKWNTRLAPYEEIISEALAQVKRHAPFDLINFPEASQYCVDADGNITLTVDDIERIRL